jgi:hypothetical protein
MERRTMRQPRERAATRYGRVEARGRVAGPPFATAVAGVVDGASDPAVRDVVSADIFSSGLARVDQMVYTYTLYNCSTG